MATTRPQRELSAGYRIAAGVAAIGLLAGGFVGALATPGVGGLVGYGLSAVAAGSVGVALYVASGRERDDSSTQLTSLAAGLLVLVALVDVVMIVTAAVLREPMGSGDIRLGVLLVTVLLALVIGGIGVFAPSIHIGRSARRRSPRSPRR